MMRFTTWIVAAAVTALGAMPAVAQPWQPANGDKLEFDVLRDGGEFGTHLVNFTREGDSLTVKTDVVLKVALGPITFFDYAHDVTERYVGSKLVWVGSRTKNGGKWKTLAAQPTEGGLSVKGDKFKGVLTGPVIPSTHWNRDEMKQPTMFSTETGEMLPIKVKDRGIEKVKAGGRMIDAQRFDVDSEIDASFWYDSAGRWVKCAFEAQGSKIEYVLRALPA
ncbi:MAG: DUF6134 family protein [Hyphomonadaceae bacterium]|nr:DUF6134 family protein [Hyphomonadaceae bacterium]